MRKLLILLGLFLLFGCATEKETPNPPESQETEPQEKPEVESYQWGPKLEAYIKAELPKYSALKKLNHKYSWPAFIKALAKSESNLDPFATYWERTMGDDGWDPHTKMKYLSEGFFQLSYSDSKWRDNCRFDIEGDREKPEKDVSKTIFNPINQVDCMLEILNDLVKKKGTPIFNRGHYWAVLKPNNRRHKVFLKYYNQYK